jgi:hypothetical protein
MKNIDSRILITNNFFILKKEIVEKLKINQISTKQSA